jgi:Putative adhesin
MNNTRSFRSETKSRLSSFGNFPLKPQRTRLEWGTRILTMTVVLLASTVVFAGTPQGSFDRTLQVSGPINLEVLTHSGDITIHAGAPGSVTIHWFAGKREGDVHAIEQNPPIRQDGNSIHIDYVNYHDISVDYEITVPSDSTIHSHSGSGDQVIEGTHGNVDAETGSGDVKLSGLTGEVHLQTGSGDVRAHQISGPIRGGTGSGDVEIEETGSGDIDLHTGSGNISARGIQGAFRGQAGSGDITAEGTQSGTWEIRTGSGNVSVRLPANAAFDADISTSSGTIEVNSPIEMTVQGRVNDTRKQIHGKVHGGGPLLSVRTGSGDIHID